MAALLILSAPVFSAEPKDDKLYAFVSEDTTTVRQDEHGLSPFIREKAIELPGAAIDQMNNSLLLLDGKAADFDNRAKAMQIDEIEVSYKITAEGKFAIVGASTEGALKYVLKKRKSPTDAEAVPT